MMISLFFHKFPKACFSSLVRLEGTFFDEFRTLTILLLVILATDAGGSRRPFSASDIIFCLGIVFCETGNFEPNAKTLVSVSVSQCFEIIVTCYRRFQFDFSSLWMTSTGLIYHRYAQVTVCAVSWLQFL